MAAGSLANGCRWRRTWPTANPVLGKHSNVGLLVFCLGDREMIDWGLSGPGAHGQHKGGFYQVMNTMIEVGHF